MSVLLGIELSGSRVTVTVVDRQGSLVESFEEPLSEPVTEWWRCHPEERYRTVIAALEEAVARGAVRGEQIAAIGLAAEPGLVLLDAELDPIPPRSIAWEEILQPEMTGPFVVEALRRLREREDRWSSRVGMILSPVDYVRFRMSGALATSVSFAWQSGLVTAAGALPVWNASICEGLGLPLRVLPPIFDAPSRVGVVTEDVVRRVGIRRGVWVNAGSDPVSALLVAGLEPHRGAKIFIADEELGTLWSVGEQPSHWIASALPGAIGGFWYLRERGQQQNPIFSPGMGAPEDEPLHIYFPDATGVETWPRELSRDIRVLHDSGGPSSGGAIQAGLGLGWWRDPRSLWRKRRAPLPYEEWRAAYGESKQSAG